MNVGRIGTLKERVAQVLTENFTDAELDEMDVWWWTGDWKRITTETGRIKAKQAAIKQDRFDNELDNHL